MKICGKLLPASYQEERPGDIRHSYLDNSRAKNVLDWTPEYDLHSGLSNTIAYYTASKEAAVAREE